MSDFGPVATRRSSDLRVLDSGPVAASLAASLGLSTRSRVPAVGEPPVVVVVADAPEVDELVALDDPWWIGCIVAWHLPESHLVRLYEAGLNVLVGLPTLAELLTAVDYPATAERHGEARRVAERLATLERALGSNS